MLGSDNDGTTDLLPAGYHYYGDTGRRVVAIPAADVPALLRRELSLGTLPELEKHLWFAGARNSATRLHFHVAIQGRTIVKVDRIDLHLLWDNNGKLFLKPVPRFLLSAEFWQSNLRCPDGCLCDDPLADDEKTCRAGPRKVALGFLYTYACLVPSETDFLVANEAYLLPRSLTDGAPIKWANWKQLVRELLESHDCDQVHPRFHRAELRLPRLDRIHRFTCLPPFTPYLRRRYNYGGFFRDNLAWMAAATVFIALVLTAMQVGLATDVLHENADFQRASYGFTVFAILGPICVFALLVLRALLTLAQDLPWLWGGKASARYRPKAPTPGGRNPRSSAWELSRRRAGGVPPVPA